MWDLGGGSEEKKGEVLLATSSEWWPYLEDCLKVESLSSLSSPFSLLESTDGIFVTVFEVGRWWDLVWGRERKREEEEDLGQGREDVIGGLAEGSLVLVVVVAVSEADPSCC